MSTKQLVVDFIYFGWKQALNCIFPGTIFATLWLSTIIHTPLHRYDFIFIVLLFLQILFLATKYEKVSDLKPIITFHLLGLIFEIAKVNAGRWQYPEESNFMLMGVPLYSGFLYASVASYILQANNRLKIHYLNWPSTRSLFLLSAGIYLNFFTNIFIADLRIILILIILFLFARVKVAFTPRKKVYTMPMLAAFLMIAVFIWIAENISTFFKAWVYPHQAEAWRVVDLQIISSWFLFVVFILSLVNWRKSTRVRRDLVKAIR